MIQGAPVSSSGSRGLWKLEEADAGSPRSCRRPSPAPRRPQPRADPAWTSGTATAGGRVCAAAASEACVLARLRAGCAGMRVVSRMSRTARNTIKSKAGCGECEHQAARHLRSRSRGHGREEPVGIETQLPQRRTWGRKAETGQKEQGRGQTRLNRPEPGTTRGSHRSYMRQRRLSEHRE